MNTHEIICKSILQTMGMDAWYEADFPQRNQRGAMRSPISIRIKKIIAEKSSIKVSGAYDKRGRNSNG